MTTPRTRLGWSTLAIACAALILPITWVALFGRSNEAGVMHAIGLGLGLALAGAGLHAIGLGPRFVAERAGGTPSPFNPIQIVMTLLGGSLVALGVSLGIAAALESLA